MFSTKTNIQQLTSLLIKANVAQAVVCPGSRNSAIVHNLQAAGIECFNITDERSAGFFAIGLIEANGGKPVAVCVTSGSAVLNLAPAVSEAYYRNFPLLVITADRPLRWIGQMDGQTLPQPNAFGSMVAKCVSLPEPTDEEGEWYCNRLINEALIEQQRTSRPVQINVPITEPMFDFSATELPNERLVKFHDGIVNEEIIQSSNTLYNKYKDSAPFVLDDILLSTWKNATRTLIIVGQMLPDEMEQCAPYLILLAKCGCAIYAENLSNIHTFCNESLYSSADQPTPEAIAASKDGKPSVIVPDLIITIGGHIVSKTLKKHIRKNPPIHHWHVSPLGELADLFMHCTDLVAASPVRLLLALSMAKADKAHEKHFTMAEYGLIVKPVEKTATTTALQILLERLTPNWHIQVANSTMVRALQQVFHDKNYVHCNRGVNGIEGSSSTAIGYCTGSGKSTLLLTGDLSFFYDQNAFWNNYAKKPCAPFRVLIVNNGCGEIFHHLPGLSSPYLDSSIAASHKTTAQGIAMECGARYLTASNRKELQSVLPMFLNNEYDTAILEINC